MRGRIFEEMEERMIKEEHVARRFTNGILIVGGCFYLLVNLLCGYDIISRKEPTPQNNKLFYIHNKCHI